MSQIGKRGFTLVEIMVAVAVLSLGIVMLYEAFFTTLTAHSYSGNRLDAQRWIDEKIWQMEDELVHSGSLTLGEHIGSFMGKNKDFLWIVLVNLVGEAEDTSLYRLNLRVSWKESQRNVDIYRVAYVEN